MYRSCPRVLLFAAVTFLGLAVLGSSSSKARDIVHLSGFRRERSSSKPVSGASTIS